MPTTIHYRNDVRGSGVDARALKTTMRALMRAVGEGDAAISVSLVDDAAVREINREHRGKDKPTDVLSFPLEPEPFSEERLLGDIVISVDTARRQAADYDAPLQREVYRLLIHGLLHVLGHDHEKPVERARMEAEERRLAEAIAMPWPY
ncbi:MAG TPA: rRNA maturation RNase YbeY [Candidatus Baltobacteraceae bacterium]|nr:rRNA maturation RNase YbeY [Candidatus Baltobacteraceae bacterium]